MRQQYTSPVTPQYKAATKARKIRYTIERNFAAHPEVKKDYLAWKGKATIEPARFPVNDIFHPNHLPTMFDVRDAEIREDWGQRNALLEKTRKTKILGMAKNFDPKLFEPISVDYIADENDYIIRDGGGRAHAAFLCGMYRVPATVRYVDSYEESRRLFNAQDKYAAAISSYDKFLQQLLNKDHSRHNVASDTWSISKSSGFSLHYSDKSTSTPLVEGLGVLQNIIRKVGGDAADVKWGARKAPNLTMAVDVIKHAFSEKDDKGVLQLSIDEIPASILFALTSYIHISKGRLPSGDEGIRRLKQFVVDIRDSSEKLKDINAWVAVLGLGLGSNLPTHGASALMEKWNEIYKYKNKGIRNKAVYKWVIWSPAEISTIKMNIIPFKEDDALFPE
jgi:hypothetical protein